MHRPDVQTAHRTRTVPVRGIVWREHLVRPGR